jgi:hypothetical protein
MRQLALLPVLLVAALLWARSGGSSENATQPLRRATFCELAAGPAAYNHQLLQMTVFLTHGFENFQLADPNCAASTQHFSIWVMYGGKTESNTAYCCPGETGGEKRSEPLTVEGIQIPLVDDSIFRRFMSILNKESDTTVRVTVTGTFFSGTQRSLNGTTLWGGYGHMGCCSLFVIQRVDSFEPHARIDLDYTSEAGFYEKEGCRSSSTRDLTFVSIPDGTTDDAIKEQMTADQGRAPWAFNDPREVALRSLKSLYPVQTPKLRLVRQSPSRRVFQWSNANKSVTVVVSRPYWLSFYASSSSVVWVATMIKEAECD